MANQTQAESLNPLLHFLEEVFASGNVKLHDKLMHVKDDSLPAVQEFLQNQFEKEALDFPYSPPKFDPPSALWSASFFYSLSQLFLFRNNAPGDLEDILSEYEGSIGASQILSADLCLRFIPSLLLAFEQADEEDPVLPLVESRLKPFHFSMIPRLNTAKDLDFDPILSNPTLRQLYVDRVIHAKNTALAKCPIINPYIEASLGIHKDTFWPTL